MGHALGARARQISLLYGGRQSRNLLPPHPNGIRRSSSPLPNTLRGAVGPACPSLPNGDLEMGRTSLPSRRDCALGTLIVAACLAPPLPVEADNTTATTGVHSGSAHGFFPNQLEVETWQAHG